jgi:formylglycine-generating enzyme required for sulfatase activity
MPVMENLFKIAVEEILKKSAGKAWKSATRNDKVLKVLGKVGLKSGTPDQNFESVYTHTLVEYGIEKPEPVLNFFRHKDIRKAFQEAFEKSQPSILNQEAEHLIQWNKIGDELRGQQLDPRLEFAGFALVFHEMVDRTCTPAEVRRENKLDEILQLTKEGKLNQIRAKNIEKIQGSLAEHLKSWFKTLGYGIGGHDIRTSDCCEWIIKIPARRGFDSILVQCIERQAEVKDLKLLKSLVTQYEADEGWLIAGYRKSPSARDMADKEADIFCYTFDELLDQHADFTRYFNWLETFVKDKKINTDYISLACRRDIYDQNSKEKTGEEHYGKEENWIEGYIDRWLEDPCKEHISILGEFGTGKTWFTHHYAYQLMKKYIEAKDRGLKRPRLPLVVHLRDYAKALNSESLFSDFFFRKHEIPLPGYSTFEQLNRMGKLLLIFDGFDEMADKLDRQKMINNFWELARVVVPGAKTILTCRTEHFPNAREGRDLLSAELKASTANLTGDPPQFEMLELEMFDVDQIREALLKRTNQRTVDVIMNHPELLDLASRPVMLEFILEALPDIEAGNLIDLSRIYLYAINAKLERDIKNERTFTSLADKLYFMCELSWEMLTTEKMSLNYRLFPDRLKNLFGPIVTEEKDLDHWHYDMMGNTLLIRNDDGDYTPAHRSLLEFFVAFKIMAQMGLLPSDFTNLARSQSNIDKHSRATDCMWSSYFRREVDAKGEIRPIPPLGKFCPEDKEMTLASLGRMGEAVLRFVHEMTNVEEVRPYFHKLLSEIMVEFKAGNRDPQKEQDIIRFILNFRALSQEWEAQAEEGTFIRDFWEDQLEQEMETAGEKVKLETMRPSTSGGESVEIEMVQIPAGAFLMGDEVDGPIHRVEITKPFMIAAVPVTQALYQAVADSNPSHFQGDHLPVENINWFEALQFCNDLSKMLDLDLAYRIEGELVEWDQESVGFRLPTEAEWEYTCRAGTTTRFACGDLESDLETMGWYKQNSGDKTHPMKGKLPNAWGLYDMHGNVREWVWDLYGKYPGGLAVDPVGQERGASRVMRGGSWGLYALRCRSAFRGYYSPGYRGFSIGFRLARSVALGS